MTELTERLSSTARLLPLLLLPLLLLLASCDNESDAGDNGNNPPPATGARLELVVEGLDFPLYVTSPPGDPRLFIVEKSGTIRIFKKGELLPNPFLDLSGQVSGGSEQGLLSMAFHPDFAANGRFFVSFTNRDGDSRVIEHRVSSHPDRAETAPVGTILALEQPFSNHNGGLILFGPDGMLYLGFGDGGSGGDPQENGQNLGTLLGKILRIDVDSGAPYTIPPDNPFAGRKGAREEIWAYGLRNPWRFAFDRANGDLYIADVGQWKWEEVHVAAAGAGGQNYGWDIMEGAHCFEPPSNCDRKGLVLPVIEFDHSNNACSITGGYVYRGSAIPDLVGTYFYADYCAGFVRSFKFAGGRATEEQSWPALQPPGSLIGSFGEDADGELYICTGGGAVYKVVPK
jgi:glucose/arabinose dehydrogenase